MLDELAPFDKLILNHLDYNLQTRQFNSAKQFGSMPSYFNMPNPSLYFFIDCIMIKQNLKFA